MPCTRSSMSMPSRRRASSPSSSPPRIRSLPRRLPMRLRRPTSGAKQDTKKDTNTAATGFLGPEITDLQNRVKEAEAKVAAFRSQSDLLMGGNNAVLATQQLSEQSSELSRVRANRAAAEATADSVRRALQNGGTL